MDRKKQGRERCASGEDEVVGDQRQEMAEESKKSRDM